MTISDRNALKRRFTNDTYLSEKDFASLIESTVNKRTDQFHGIWQKGSTYRENDVVIHERQLWLKYSQGSGCAERQPGEDSANWKVFPDDGDWNICPKRQAMWADVFDKVGIAVGSNEASPQARLDVRKIQDDAKNAYSAKVAGESVDSTKDAPSPSFLAAASGRWLVFPQGSTQTQTTLIHYKDQPTSSPITYLINGLSTQTATWCTDASQGFSFCRGSAQTQEDDVLSLSPEGGETMLVVQPRSLAPLAPDDAPEPSAESTPARRHLGSLGLNTTAPQALVDLVDTQRGSLRFLPDFAQSSTLYLLGTGCDAEVPYVSLGVTARETSLVSNAVGGFGFYRGQGYDTSSSLPDTVLLKVLQSEHFRPQVGIGTDAPAARLDIHAQDDRVQVQLLPEHPGGEAMPAMSLYRHRESAPAVELTAAIATRAEATVSGWQTSANRGFVFQQIEPVREQSPDCKADAEPPEPGELLQGRTQVAIREQGFVGIGTEEPTVRLEISGNSGQVRVEVDGDGERSPQPTLSLCKLASGHRFALSGTDTHGVLTTDTVGGFEFTAPSINSLYTDAADTGRRLVNISPEGLGRVGIGCAPRDYELDVQGTVQARAIYADTNADQVREVKPLYSTLWKLQNLNPITFEWNTEALEIEATEDAAPETEAASATPETELIADLWADSEPAIAPPTAPTSPAETAAADETALLNSKEQIGLLAHQVAEHFPQVVKTANDGSQSVAYTSLVPVLVQAINELNRKHHQDVRQLETQIEQQANRIALLATVIGVWAAIAFLKLLF